MWDATITNLSVFGLTRSGLEPTIYRTRGEHTNHYTTDTIYSIYDSMTDTCRFIS